MSYRGWTFTWEKGRQLKTAVKGGDSLVFTYNANGIRTSKTVGGVTHTYTLEGAKILREAYSTVTLDYLYDNEESICGLKYNGTPYYFYKNLQGDIIAIKDANDTVVARYSYDAWGVCTIVSDDSGVSIATKNPFRYRGYYYDSETGFYYLQSRYYDPVVGRFINADDANILGIDRKILSNNLLAYCINNPVMYFDPSGHQRVYFAFLLEIEYNGTLNEKKCREILQVLSYEPFGIIIYKDISETIKLYEKARKWWKTNMSPYWFWMVPDITHIRRGWGLDWKYVNGKRTNEKELHDGLDIGTKAGQGKSLGKIIVAPKDGKVVEAGWNKYGGGNKIVIEHENGKYQTIYYHLQNIYVKKGQYVFARGIIGTIGSTGNSSGAHLHFTITRQKITDTGKKDKNGEPIMKISYVAFNPMTIKWKY